MLSVKVKQVKCRKYCIKKYCNKTDAVCLYFLWYFLFSYMKANVFLEILLIPRNLAFFLKKQLLWNYHPIALVHPFLTLLLIFTSDSIWPEQQKTDFITWLRGNGIREGEDYTTWSVTKVNKYTFESFFFLFFSY